MIKSFQHRGLKSFFTRGNSRLLNPGQLKRIKLLLDILDAAEEIEAINVAGAYLHELKGKRKGTWSIKVSANWRITFRFEDSNVYDLNLEDYH